MPNAFLDAYQAAKNQNQQTDAANLNLQVGQMGLLSKIKAQQEQQKVQEILMSSPDQQTAMTRLSKGEGGMVGFQVAQHLGQLIKQQSDATMNQQLSGAMGGPSTPDQLDMIGQKLAIGGHPGAATVMNIADKRRTLAQNSDVVKSMQSVPASPAITPDPQESQQVADLGTPVVQSIPAKQGSGGALDYLMNSPYVGTSAKALQEQINKSGNRIPVSVWENRIASLDKMHNTMSQQVAMQKQGQANRLEIKVSQPQASSQASPDVVQGLVDYSIPISTLSTRQGMGGAPSERAKYLAAAKQLDPNFSVQEYGLRYGVRQDFMKGKTADNIVALDQALNHMGTLKELGVAMQNNDIPASNKVINFVKTQTGDPSVNNFDTAKQAVGTELMRVFRQVNASEIETKAWEERFQSSQSPQQMLEALQVGAKLLDGRVKAINNRWNRAMHTTDGYPEIMSPGAKEALDRIMGNSQTPSQKSSKVVDFGSLR